MQVFRENALSVGPISRTTKLVYFFPETIKYRMCRQGAPNGHTSGSTAEWVTSRPPTWLWAKIHRKDNLIPLRGVRLTLSWTIFRYQSWTENIFLHFPPTSYQVRWGNMCWKEHLNSIGVNGLRILFRSESLKFTDRSFFLLEKKVI